MRSPVKFGAKGIERHAIDPEAIPFEHRGCYTGHLYVWTEQKPARMVDKRDLPGLRKVAADKLPDLDKPAPKKRKAQEAAAPVESATGGIDE